MSSLIEYSASRLFEKLKEKRLYVRLILLVKDYSPHDQSEVEKIFFTIRPWWSLIGKKVKALPGGRIDPEDFNPKINWHQSPTKDQIIAAACVAIERELLEEFKFLIPFLPEMVLITESEEGYLSIVFLMNLLQKPTLALSTNSDADGIAWILQEEFETPNDSDFFQDHHSIVAAVLEL